MVDNKEENSNAGFEQIKPVAIDLSRNNSVDDSVTTKKNSKKALTLGLGLGALVLSALVVIFLLPRWIEPPKIDTTEVTPTSSPTSSAPARSTKPAAESPWERAQQSKMRKETQEILAKMLDAQKALEDSGVTEWAEEEYAQAIQHAQSGDKLYNQRDFTAARTAYQEAFNILDALMEQVDDVFKATLEKGHKALDEEDSGTALEAFKLALAIDAIDRDANIGYERAQTLDQVSTLIDEGDDLLGQQQLEQAKVKYQEALKIDDKSPRAARQIQLADEKILDRNFNEKMSAGFNALQNKQYTQARQAFTSALKLKPKSVEARSAINQTRHTITTLNINSLLADGRKLETQERWHDALSKYENALELNPNLAEAQEGQKRSAIRKTIHDKLQKILDNPERLYDKEVYLETVAFHKKLSGLSSPGPVLSKQLSNLETKLEKAIKPVTVRFQSDNLTRIILYRVGALGYFLDKEISVSPGRYVAVGQRDGYRDVRVEFMVDPDKPTETVRIQAQEKIALKR